MTHLWVDGEPISVQADGNGVPISFVWRDQAHAILSITNRWRIDEGWWKERVWRECFKLLTSTGWLVIIYRDLRTGDWRLQRIYD